MQDDLQKAYSAYQEALYLLPNPKEDPKLWYGIGILYDRYGSLDHAEEAFASVLQMDKGMSFVHLYVSIGTGYSYVTALDFDKANEILFRLGIIYKQQGKYNESLECFDRILRNPPSPLANADIWFQIGHVYEQQKDHVHAKEAYEKVVQENPAHAKVLQQLGWLYHQDGSQFQSQDLAITYLTKSLEADSTDAQSWYLLGRAYMAGQKYNKAYEAYQQAVYRDGRNPTFWCSIGVLYFQINQYRDALDAYSRAIRINPYISEVWFDLGSLYESCNNQISDAIDAYARAAELDQTNQVIAQRLSLLRQAQANGTAVQGQAPVPQDVHPTAYASAVGPPMSMQGGPGPGGPPPPSGLGGAGSQGPPMLMSGAQPQRSIFRSESSRELAPAPVPPPSSGGAPIPDSPHGRVQPFSGGPPPPVILNDEGRRGGATPLAPMDVDRVSNGPGLPSSSNVIGINGGPAPPPPPPREREPYERERERERPIMGREHSRSRENTLNSGPAPLLLHHPQQGGPPPTSSSSSVNGGIVPEHARDPAFYSSGSGANGRRRVPASPSVSPPPGVVARRELREMRDVRDREVRDGYGHVYPGPPPSALPSSANSGLAQTNGTSGGRPRSYSGHSANYEGGVSSSPPPPPGAGMGMGVPQDAWERRNRRDRDSEYRERERIERERERERGLGPGYPPSRGPASPMHDYARRNASGSVLGPGTPPVTRPDSTGSGRHNSISERSPVVGPSQGRYASGSGRYVDESVAGGSRGPSPRMMAHSPPGHHANMPPPPRRYDPRFDESPQRGERLERLERDRDRERERYAYEQRDREREREYRERDRYVTHGGSPEMQRGGSLLSVTSGTPRGPGGPSSGPGSIPGEMYPPSGSAESDRRRGRRIMESEPEPTGTSQMGGLPMRVTSTPGPGSAGSTASSSQSEQKRKRRTNTGNGRKTKDGDSASAAGSRAPSVAPPSTSSFRGAPPMSQTQQASVGSPEPGSGASVSGSSGRSERRSPIAAPSGTNPFTGLPRREVDEDYDEGVAESLMSLAQGGPVSPTVSVGGRTRVIPGPGPGPNSAGQSPQLSGPVGGVKRPLSPVVGFDGEAKRTRMDILSRPGNRMNTPPPSSALPTSGPGSGGSSGKRSPPNETKRQSPIPMAYNAHITKRSPERSPTSGPNTTGIPSTLSLPPPPSAIVSPSASASGSTSGAPSSSREPAGMLPPITTMEPGSPASRRSASPGDSDRMQVDSVMPSVRRGAHSRSASSSESVAPVSSGSTGSASGRTKMSDMMNPAPTSGPGRRNSGVLGGGVTTSPTTSVGSGNGGGASSQGPATRTSP